MSIFGLMAVIAALSAVGIKWGFLIAAQQYERRIAAQRQECQDIKVDYQASVRKQKATVINIKQLKRDKAAFEKKVFRHRQSLAELQKEQKEEELLRRLQKDKLEELKER